MAEHSGPDEEKRNSGLPGGGAGRRDEVGGSGVYPMSGPLPASNAPIVPQGSFGQGELGAAGYQESGTSELWFSDVNPEQCRDIMSTDPVCCARSATLETASRIMRERDIGGIPIVEDDSSKKLIGFLTDRDIVIRAVAGGLDCKSTAVEQVMSRELITCSPEDSIQACVDAMESKQVRRIPIVDSAGRILGMVAQADIALRTKQPGPAGEVVREISKPNHRFIQAA